MEAPKSKSSRLASTIRWVARILCILAIAFISMFAFDAFEQGSLGQKIVAFLMHMIPSFVLIIALIIAWKHELVGGILITLIGLATAVFIFNLGGPQVHLPQKLMVVTTFSVPIIIVGVLFIISYILHRPNKLTTQIA